MVIVILTGALCLPSATLGQQGPPPDSPRGQAITKLYALLDVSDEDLESVVDELIAPSLKEEKGRDLIDYLMYVREELEGFSARGFRPVGPTTVGATYEGAGGEFEFQFSVEEEKPYRLTSITFDE